MYRYIRFTDIIRPKNYQHKPEVVDISASLFLHNGNCKFLLTAYLDHLVQILYTALIG